MPLTSDVTIVAAKFNPSAVDDTTHKTVARLTKITEDGPQWYEVGAPEARRIRLEGRGAFPKPTILESGKTSSIPSRDEGRTIPIRVFTPENGASKGIFMHIHGGGWVLGTEAASDPYLRFLASNAGLTVISVGYRLCPEDPFPAPTNDCYDAAEYLVDNAKSDYGVPLLFVGGESAGGHLTALVCFHLLKARPSFSFAGIVLNYGVFDLANFLPQAHLLEKPAVLTLDIMSNFVNALVPNSTLEFRRSPEVSPFYANLRELASHSDKKQLPPALFTCGTDDILLDDTMMMSVKWQMAGGESIVRIFPGAPHGFTGFPPSMMPAAGEAMADVKTFLLEKMA